MKKFAVGGALVLATATQALAGGYAAPVIEAEPIAVEAAAAPSGGILIPALLALVVVAAIASNNGGDNDAPPDGPR